VDVCLLYSLFKTGLSIRSSRFIPRAREGRWAGREDTTRLIFLSLIKSRIARPATWPLPPAVRERGRNRKKTEWAQVWVALHCPPLRAPVGHANAESQPYDAAGGCYKVPMDTDTSAIAGRDGRFQNGQAHACTRAHSRPIRPVGRGHLRPATQRLSGCTQHIDWHASPSLHRFGDLRELSVPLLSGTGSRFGTGVGEEQTASGAIDRRSPGQPVAVAPCACRLCCVACSKSIACQICAPLGHGPKTATVRWIAAASAPADGLGETGCASPPSAILSHRPSCPRRTSCWARDKIR